MERMILCVIFAIFSASSVQCKCAVCVPYSGIYNCASNRFLRFNCVRLASFTSGNAREVRIKNCKVNVFIGNGITGKQRYPVVRDKSGITCPHFEILDESDVTRSTTILVTKRGTEKAPSTLAAEPSDRYATKWFKKSIGLGSLKDDDNDVFDQPSATEILDESDVTRITTILVTKRETEKAPSTLAAEPTDRYATKWFKKSIGLGSLKDDDNDVFDQPSATGFLAWAITCTLTIILIILKKYLRTCHPCNCVRAQSAPQQDIPLSTIHTPPSLATTPSSTYSTPQQSDTSVQTPSSTNPLLNNPPAKSTRSKTRGKVLFAL